MTHLLLVLHKACSRTENPDSFLLLRSCLSQRGLLCRKTGCLHRWHFYFSLFRRPGSPGSRHGHIQCPARTRLPILGRCLLAASLCGGRSWELTEVSFVRVLMPSVRAPPSWPNHLPKAPPPTAIALGVRVSTQDWGGACKRSAHCRSPVWCGSNDLSHLLPVPPRLSRHCHHTQPFWPGAQSFTSRPRSWPIPPPTAPPLPAPRGWLSWIPASDRASLPSQCNEAIRPLSLS